MGEAVDPEHLAELFAGFGRVSVRRMFGGAGVFADGLMFALMTHGVIYLKADALSEADFAAEGLAPFSYRTNAGMRTLKSYWRMPDRLYDDPDELVDWAQRALNAARHQATRQPPRSKHTGTRRR